MQRPPSITSNEALMNYLKSLENKINVIENKGTGTIGFIDEATGVETIIGELPDGTVGLQEFINDVEPPVQPSAPGVASGISFLRVAWDGLDVLGGTPPKDYARTIIEKSTDGTSGWTAVDEVYGNAAAIIGNLPIDAPTYIRLVSVDRNGNRSIPSVTASGTPLFQSPETQALIDEAVQNAIDASDLASSKIKTYFQTSSPALTGNTFGDLWFDTDEGNKVYIWNGSAWNSAQDAKIPAVESLASSKIKTYFQTSSPALTGNTFGDLWFDTDDGNKVYLWNGSAWSTAQDAKIPAIETLASSKIKVYYQNNSPALTGNTYGDTWYKTDEGNKIYLWTGSAWTSAQDQTILAVQQVAQSKTKTYFQANSPALTGNTVGDTWFDTDDGNKIYVWNGSAWFDAQDDAIATALANAQAANNLASSKIKVYFQSASPALTGNTFGDTWFNTSAGNKPYVWNGSAWTSAQDASIADAATLASSKIKVYSQSTSPALTGNTFGDTWYDTSAGNKPYVWTGSAWTSAQDASIAAANTLASSKTKTYFQSTSPALTGNTFGDTWFDTGTGNKPYVWNGSAWFSAQDASIAAANTLASSKTKTYFQSNSPALTGNIVGDTWFDTANGNLIRVWNGSSWASAQDAAIAAANTLASSKIKVYYQSTSPALTGNTFGDTWFDTSTGNKPYVWTGSAWTNAQDQKIISVDAVAQAKTKTYFQSTSPALTGNTVGDTWFDTGNGNKIFVWNGSSWFSAQDAAIQTALNNAQTANNLASSKIKVYSQATSPALTGNTFGDTWYDTSTGNKPYVWTGSAWTSAQDASIAAASTLASSKTKTYYQSTAPSNTGNIVGDTWFDTGNGNRIYVWNGSAWTNAQDAAIAAANTLASSKIKVYYQASSPALTGNTFGDTWFDTSTGNKPYVWTGSAWTSAQDASIASANSLASSKTKTYFQSTSPALTGNTVGDTWFDTGNGNLIRVWNGSAWSSAQDAAIAAANTLASSKIKVYFQTAQPAVTGNTFGDTWFDTDDGNKVYVWNGSAWTSAQDTSIATAQGTANTALTSANGKNKTYFQSTSPALTGNVSGDTWFDTGNGNKIYVWNGSAWVNGQDAAITTAQSTANTAIQNAQTADSKAVSATNIANSKNVILSAASAPATAGRISGDTWFDTANGNKPYTFNGTTWVSVQDASIATAQGQANTALTTANGKTKTFITGTQPTATTVGDIWIDTANGNVIKTWEGSSWVTRADAAIAAAQGTANTALTNAATADGKAVTAQNIANGKNVIISSASAPATAGRVTGDTWFDTANGNKPMIWNGSAWVSAQDASIATAQSQANTALTTANGKTKTFIQGTTPTATTTGDIWIDTANGNVIKTWEGSAWVTRADAAIAAAQGTANTAVTNAATADGKAVTATNIANSKNVIISAASAPATSGRVTGDTWFDTANGNKPMVWNGSAWVSAQDASIATAQSAANTALTTANGKTKTFIQGTTPTATTTGDIWIDTANGNVIKTWEGSSWVTRADAAIAAAQGTANTAVTNAATADGKAVSATNIANSKNVILSAASAPATAGRISGDAWFDTANGNKPYIFNGTAWVSAQDASIATAQSAANTAITNAATADGKAVTAQNTANTKTKTYYQSTSPALTGNTAGDLWFDTSAGNKPYVWNGAWSSAQDASIATAQSVATSAQTAANGKNKVVYSTSAATGTSYVDGDTWFQKSGTLVIAQWEFLGGSWQSRKVDGQNLANLNAGTVTAGSMSGQYITAGTLTADRLLVGDFTNMLDDPDFTSGAGWSVGGQTSVVGISLGVEGQATNALRIIANSSVLDVLNKNVVTVQAGDRFYGEIWVKQDGNGTTGNLHFATTVRLADGTSTYPAFQQVACSTIQSASWTLLKGVAIMPTNAVSMTPRVSVRNDATNGTFYFDRAVVRRQSNATMIQDGTITTTQIAAGTINAGNLAAASITATALAGASITATALAANSITATALAANSITATAIAADTITAGQIASGAITAAELSAGSVSATAIAANSITATALAANSITATALAVGSVSATAIAADSITAGQIASGAVTAGELAAGAVTASAISANAITATALAAGSVSATAIAADSITAGQIASGAITAAELSAGSVSATAIAANSITATALAANSITATALAVGSVSATAIAADSITAGQIASGAITAGELAAGAVTASAIAANSITATALAANSVSATAIVADSITAGQIASGAITAAELSAGSVSATAIAANSITATALAANSITATALAANSITATALAAGSVSATAIAADSITAGQIASGAVTAGELAAGAVTASAIAANSITATALAAQSITATAIAADTITAGNIAAGAITGSELSAGSVSATAIAANSITATALAAQSITATALAVGSITATAIAASAIKAGSAIIENGAISSAQIGSLDAAKITSGVIDSNRIATNSLTANKIAVTDFNNLFDNGRFDIGTDGLTGWNSGNGTVVADAAASSGKALRIDGLTGSYPARYQTRDIPCAPGEKIRVKGMVMRSATANSVPSVRTMFLNAAKTSVANSGVGATVPAADTWGPLNGTTTAPAGTAYVRLWVEYSGLTGSYGYVTDLQAYRMNAGELIVDGSITANFIAGQSITATALAANSITASALAAGSITATAIAADSITATAIAANAVTAQELAAGSITATAIAAGSITASALSAQSITATAIAAGSITATALGANSITATALAANSITATAIGANQVTAAALAANSITATALAAGSITATAIGAGSITATALAANSITATAIAAGSVTAAALAAQSITATALGAQSVSATAIGAGSITATALAAQSITATAIAANQITASALAAGSITATALAANSITATAIGAQQVTATKMLMTDMEELVPNPTFHPTGEPVTQGTVMLATTTPVSAGAPSAYVLKLTQRDTQPFNNVAGIPVKAGDQFYVEAMVAAAATTTRVFNHYIFFSNAPTSGYSAVLSRSQAVTGTWTKHGYSFTVPSGWAYMKPYLQVETVGGDTVDKWEWYVANWSLRHKNTGELIVDGTIQGNHIKANNITASALAAGSITATAIAAGSITATALAAQSITATALAAQSISATALAAQSITATAIGANQVTAAALAANSVTATAMAAQSITATALGAGSITASALAAQSITATAIGAGSINASALAAQSITATALGAQSVSATAIAAQSVTATALAAQSITATAIGANQVTAAALAAGSITATAIAAGSITATAIGAGSITATALAAQSITATAIGAGSITASALAAQSITATALGAQSVSATAIKAQSITATALAAQSITATAIAANQITASALAAGSITATALAANSITATAIGARSITTDKLLIASTDNLVSEPDFTGNGLAWGLPATGFSIDPVAGRDGGPALKLVNTAAQVGRYNLPQEVPVEALSYYTIASWVKADVAIPAGGIRLYIRTRDGAGAFSYLSIASPAIAANTWQRFSGTIQIPTGAITASFAWFSEAIFSTGNVWTDFISVNRAMAGELIVDGSIQGNHIKANNITASALAAGSITATALASQSITATAMAAQSITATAIAAQSISATAMAAQSITATALGAGSITASALAAQSITATAIGAGSITATAIAAQSITATALAAQSITATAIGAQQIGAAAISGQSITATALAAGSITATAIAANSITATALAANSITATAIGAQQIGASALAAQSITATALAAQSIGATALAAQSITATALGAGSITATALAAESITATAIKAGEIGAQHLSAAAITATAINASSFWSDSSWLGQAGASTLTLKSTSAPVTAGSTAASGMVYVTTSSEVSSQGFRVYNIVKDPDGTVLDDGSTNPIIQLGTFSSDSFQLNRGDASNLIRMDSSGKITAKSIEVENLSYDGNDLDYYLDRRPRGMVAWGQVPITTSMACSAGAEIGLFELSWDAQDALDATADDNLNLQRMYQFNVNDFIVNAGGAGIYGLRLRMTTDGSVPSITSPIVGFKYWRTDVAGLTGSGSFTRLIGSSNGASIRVLLTLYSSGSNANVYNGAGQTYLYSSIQDLGASISPAAVASTGGGTPYNGAPPVSAPATAKVTRTVEYGYYGSRSFLPSGAAYNYNVTKAYQGLSPAGYGNLSSQYTFNQNFQTLLTGATVNDIWVYLYFEHWYNNAGGTARIRLHNNLTTPSTNVGMTANGIDSANWARGAGRWVRLPSSLYAGFQSGAYKGFGLTGDGTYNTYGIANNARIRIRYTK